jgi:hypothetical protein
MRKLGFHSFITTTAVPVDQDDKFIEIERAPYTVASYARSIAEAGFRRDTVQLRIYRPQFHRAVVELMATIRDAAPINGGAR